MNSIPNPSKNYQYVLDAVYFHRDDNHFSFDFSSSSYHLYKENPDHVMQVLLTDSQSGNSVAGYASGLSQDIATKYTKIANAHSLYVQHIQNINAQYSWTMHAVGSTFQHEIGHLLGLSHTVRENHSPPCATNNSNCDDDCSDTVSAYDMINVYNSTHHPACGWNQGTQPGCTNNMMDYAGANALSPCQIDIIHCGLKGGLKNYTVCDALVNDELICSFGYPQIAHYGKKVTIEGCTGSLPILEDKEEANIYFSNEVEFNTSFEVKDDATFEAFYVAACP